MEEFRACHSSPELAFGKLKRYETYRGSKATRGRVAIQNISKRRETRRTPKGNELPLL